MTRRSSSGRPRPSARRRARPEGPRVETRAETVCHAASTVISYATTHTSSASTAAVVPANSKPVPRLGRRRTRNRRVRCDGATRRSAAVARTTSMRTAPPDRTPPRPRYFPRGSAKLPECATAGCPSRSSRPSSSVTRRSPTTSRRARSPIGGSRTSGSISPTSRTACSATATISGSRSCARRSRPAGAASAPATCSSRPGPRPRSSRPRPRSSNPGTMQSSCAPTTRRTSRRRARSEPISTSWTSPSMTRGSSTSNGSRRVCART